MRQLVIIAHNMRSTHNVGSLLRTAEGLGVREVFLTGYTPYPLMDKDSRLPHLARKLDGQISKTALGAERHMNWHAEVTIEDVINNLQAQHFVVAALEQTPDAISLPTFRVPDKLALVLGREVDGLEAEVLALCDLSLQIPMFGSKESFNVVQAAAMALYHCRFAPFTVV